MSDLFWLSESQLSKVERYFPLPHGVPRVDDRRVVSGIIFVIRNGLRWRDAPKDYGPHKTLYNRFIRWSRLGVFDRIFSQLTAEAALSDDCPFQPGCARTEPACLFVFSMPAEPAAFYRSHCVPSSPRPCGQFCWRARWRQSSLIAAP